LLFITFSVTVFLFSLITALLIGVLAAVLFTVFMVVVALLIVIPTVFFTTFTATFIFLWGLGGYYILKRANEGETPDGMAIGDKLNGLTGGRMGWLIDGARKKADDMRTGVDQTPNKHGSEENGNVKTPQKQAPEQNGGVKKEKDESEDESKPDAGKATKQNGEVHKRPPKLANGAGMAKGATNGATG
jgi:hypothetical protein